MNELIDWVNAQLSERGWGNNELARRAELSSGGMSRVLAGHRNPGLEFCTGVARAFGADPVYVLRLAGLLPALPENRELEQELLHVFHQIPPAQRRVAIAALRGIAGQIPPGIPTPAVEQVPESTAEAEPPGDEPAQEIEQMFDNHTDELFLQMFDLLAKMARPEQMDQVSRMLEQRQQQRMGKPEVGTDNDTSTMDTVLHETAPPDRGGN